MLSKDDFDHLFGNLKHGAKVSPSEMSKLLRRLQWEQKAVLNILEAARKERHEESTEWLENQLLQIEHDIDVVQNQIRQNLKLEQQ